MVQGPALKEEEAQQEQTQCRHHWIIEPPQGATSWGQCKICGACKEFPNSAGDSLWERDSASPSSRWGRGDPIKVATGGDEEASVSYAAIPFAREEDEGF